MAIKRFKEDPMYQALWISRVVLAAITIAIVLFVGYLGRHVFGLI